VEPRAFLFRKYFRQRIGVFCPKYWFKILVMQKLGHSLMKNANVFAENRAKMVIPKLTLVFCAVVLVVRQHGHGPADAAARVRLQPHGEDVDAAATTTAGVAFFLHYEVIGTPM
jgi:hypothetical protein